MAGGRLADPVGLRWRCARRWTGGWPGLPWRSRLWLPVVLATMAHDGDGIPGRSSPRGRRPGMNWSRLPNGPDMRVLMLAQSQLAGDTRIIREAATLAAAGHEIHIVGRDVPADFVPPPELAVSSTRPAHGLRPSPEVIATRFPSERRAGYSCPSIAVWWSARGSTRRGHWRETARGHRSFMPMTSTRWHSGRSWPGSRTRNSCTTRTSSGAVAHGSVGRLRSTPSANAERRKTRAASGRRADRGRRHCRALRRRYGWQHLHVVRNTFEPRAQDGLPATEPVGAVYAAGSPRIGNSR